MTTPLPETGAGVLDAGGLDRLRHAARENSPQAMKAAATQFEALFLEMVMKSMRDAAPADGLFSSEQGRTMQGMLDQQYARALASRGIGLADVLARQMAPRGMPDGPAAATEAATGTATDALAPATDDLLPAPATVRAGGEARGPMALPAMPAVPASPFASTAANALHTPKTSDSSQLASTHAAAARRPARRAAEASLPVPAVQGSHATQGPAAVPLNPSVKTRQPAPTGALAGSPVSAAGASAATAATAASTPAPAALPKQRAFAQRFSGLAEAASATTGIPAKFMLAQAALESGWGRREIRQADGSSSHNVFGVKAGKGWQGPVAEVVTTEYVGGVAQRRVEKFRAYGSYAEAFADYARLLTKSPRYSAVVAAASDAVGFAKGLQKAGYATDPAYADKLRRVIARV